MRDLWFKFQVIKEIGFWIIMGLMVLALIIIFILDWICSHIKR